MKRIALFITLVTSFFLIGCGSKVEVPPAQTKQVKEVEPFIEKADRSTVFSDRLEKEQQ